MNVRSCVDKDWLLSEGTFVLFASCMYQPRYENFKKQIPVAFSFYATDSKEAFGDAYKNKPTSF